VSRDVTCGRTASRGRKGWALLMAVRLRGNVVQRIRARIVLLAVDESGMSTVEYAIGTIAAAAFGAILYTVVTGDSIVSALTNIITRALNTNV
jgi:hypothetical protein